MNNRPQTPQFEAHNPETEEKTPNRSAVKAVVDFNQSHGIKFSKTAVFDHFGVARRTGWRILAGNPRRLHNDPLRHDNRGRKKIITSQQLRKMHYLLQNEGFDIRSMTWEQLGAQVGIEGVHIQTIRTAMGSMDYHKCIACQKGWVSAPTAANRVRYAQEMLHKYPNKEDWHHVRFSDEVHFGWGPQGKLRIIRRPGERYCPDCLQERDEPVEKDRKRLHCWAAVGYNFKSSMVFYNVPGNSNGKMSLQVYKNTILEPIIGAWLKRGDNFALEEDGDSGHGTGKNRNICRVWKEENHLDYFFNCAQSPDLSPIENCWMIPKQHVRKVPHWDDETTKELIIEGWGQVSQEYINRQVESMPQRLRDVINSGGKLTGY